MADTVLDLATQLGKGVLIALGHKDGVVAKATLATALLNDGATDNAFEKVTLLPYQ